MVKRRRLIRKHTSFTSREGFFKNKRNGDDLRKAIDYFDQAIAKDPGYALAYVGLADSYLLFPNYAAVSPVDSNSTGAISDKESARARRFAGASYRSAGPARYRRAETPEAAIDRIEASGTDLKPN